MKITFFTLVLIFMALNLFPSGRRAVMDDVTNLTGNSSETIASEKKADESKEVVKMVGRVEVYGNEPHTFTGIVNEEGTQYSVYPPSQEAELRKLQGHLIEFTVIFLDEPQGFASLFLNGGTVTPVSWEVLQ